MSSLPCHPLSHAEPVLIDPCGAQIARQPAQNALERAEILRCCEASADDRAGAMFWCRSSFPFWLNAFAWTFRVNRVGADGRNLSAGSFDQHVPFLSWPVQDAAAETILACIREGQDCLIDKSRDMGATWLLLGLSLWHWLFVPDQHILLASRVEDLVDRAGDMDSMFAKLDYLIDNLPWWMLPAPLKQLQRGGQFRSHMHLGNPATRSSIDGTATTEHIGRGGRRSFVIFDEMAAMQQGSAAWAAAADTTTCRIANSTPLGPGTEFSIQRQRGVETGSPTVVTLGYWDHPDKGRGRVERLDAVGSVTGLAGRAYWWSPWFDLQVKRRNQSDLGQNVLIDHTTSGNLFFNSTIITQHKLAHARPAAFRAEIDASNPKSPRFAAAPSGRWRCWYEPDAPAEAINPYGLPRPRNFVADPLRPSPADNYAIFADPSNGKGKANSTACVLSVSTGRQVAEFADPWAEPNALAEQLVLAGRVFAGGTGGALLGWETNGPGESLYKSVLEMGYRRVFFRKRVGQRNEPQTLDYGWLSTKASKRVLLGSLDAAMRGGSVTVVSGEALAEMLHYAFMDDGGIGLAESADESTGARAAHGDRVIALAGAWMLVEESPRFVVARPAFAPGTIGAMFGTPETIMEAERQRGKSAFSQS